MSERRISLDRAGYGLLSRTLAECGQEAVTGELRVFGRPGGAFHLRDGLVVAVESPGAPGPEALLLRSGRISGEQWDGLLREPGAGRWPEAGLIAHGYAGAAQLRVVRMMALQDAVFAVVAGRVDGVEPLTDGSAASPTAPVAVGESPLRLLQEATRKLTALASLPCPVLPDRERPVAAPGADPDDLRLPDVRREILTHADGRRTARDLAFTTGRGVYSVTVEFARMLAEGLLRCEDVPVPVVAVPARTPVGPLRPVWQDRTDHRDTSADPAPLRNRPPAPAADVSPAVGQIPAAERSPGAERSPVADGFVASGWLPGAERPPVDDGAVALRRSVTDGVVAHGRSVTDGVAVAAVGTPVAGAPSGTEQPPAADGFAASGCLPAGGGLAVEHSAGTDGTPGSDRLSSTDGPLWPEQPPWPDPPVWPDRLFPTAGTDDDHLPRPGSPAGTDPATVPESDPATVPAADPGPPSGPDHPAPLGKPDHPALLGEPGGPGGPGHPGPGDPSQPVGPDHRNHPHHPDHRSHPDDPGRPQEQPESRRPAAPEEHARAHDASLTPSTARPGRLPRREPGASGITETLAAAKREASWKGFFRLRNRIWTPDSGA